MGGLVLLFLLIVAAFQIPAVQNFAAQKAVSYVEKRTSTEISLGKISIDFPKSIVLQHFYAEDQQGDTLIAFERLEADLAMWGLLKGRLDLNYLGGRNLHLHIERKQADGNFNFQFLIDALAGPKSKSTEKTAPMEIELGRIELDQIHGSYSDALADVKLEWKLDSLYMRGEDIDLAAMNFQASRLEMANGFFDIIITGVGPPSTKADTLPHMNFGLGSLSIRGVTSKIANQPAGQELNLDINRMAANDMQLYLAKQLVEIKEATLAGNSIQYIQEKTDDPRNSGGKATPWTVLMEELNVVDHRFQYDDYNIAAQMRGLDFAHMDWNGIDIQLSDGAYQVPLNLDAEVTQLEASEKSGFSVREMSGNLHIDSNKMELQKLVLRTSHSDLQMNGLLRYPSFESMAEDPGKLYIDARFQNSLLDLNDILYFQPSLKRNLNYRGELPEQLVLDGAVEGYIRDLHFDRLTASFFRQTQIVMDGRIQGLPDINELRLDLQITQLRTGRRDIQGLAPPGSIPSEINLPESMLLNATLSGSVNDLSAQIDLQSSMGSLQLDGTYAEKSGQLAAYQGEFRLDEFNLGEFIAGPDTFGMVSLSGNFDGKGLDLDEMSGQLDARVYSFQYSGYTYKNIDLEATGEQGIIGLDLHVRDSNLMVDLYGRTNLRADSNLYFATIDLKGADLQALGFSNSYLRISTKAEIELGGNQLNELSGKIAASELRIIDGSRTYPVDSILLIANNRKNHTDIRLQSEVISGYLRGNTSLAMILPELQRHINHFYELASLDTVQVSGRPNSFEFNFDIGRSKLLTELLIPDLEELSGGYLRGNYNSEDHSFNMDALIPRLVYAGMRFDSLELTAGSNHQSLEYEIAAAVVENQSIRIDNPVLSGAIEDDLIDLRLSIVEDSAYQSLLVAGQMRKMDEDHRFSFLVDGLVLDNEKWTVSSDNYLRFGPSGLLAKNIRLQNGDRILHINSRLEEFGSPLEFRFEEFQLEDLAQAFARQENLISGILNGTAVVELDREVPQIEADIQIDSLAYLQSRLGDLAAHLSMGETSILGIDAQLTGQGNQVNADGTYDLESGETELGFDIQRLNLASIEAFTAGQLKRSGGYISGEAGLSGSMSDPRFDGSLLFHNARFAVDQLNTLYRVDGEQIRFNNEAIVFDDFTLLDSVGNQAIVNGRVLIKNIQEIGFDLTAEVRDFMLINKEKTPEALYYGKLVLDGDVSVRGDINRPVIRANARVLDESDLAIVLPGSDPRLQSSGGIDAFIDRDTLQNPIMREQNIKDTLATRLRGIDLRANIRVTAGTVIKIYMDQTEGNYLQVQGEADLVAGVDPSGKLTLTGRYVIQDGEYQLLFRNIVRRTFQLQQGSYINWTGDPMEAQVDITAIHRTEAQPLPLVERQTTGLGQAELNRFRQTLPFEVVLHMEGELAQPEIDFDIELPPNERGALGGQVQAQLNILNQEESGSELNKQVFALLVMGRFLPRDPFALEGGGQSAARASVTRLLNAQLNKLTKKYVKGVGLDLSLDSYTDYSTGQEQTRTELDIGLEKTLLSERLHIRVGGNVDLETSGRDDRRAGDYIGDISIIYELNPDGNWKLRGFRKNKYEGVIDGDIIETGISIIFSRDYNKLSELFGDSDKNDNSENQEDHKAGAPGKKEE